MECGWAGKEAACLENLWEEKEEICICIKMYLLCLAKSNINLEGKAKGMYLQSAAEMEREKRGCGIAFC